MISTIQLTQPVKEQLAQLKQKPNESYEDVIVNLINEKQSGKEKLEKELIEAYQDEEAEAENIKITKEFEAIEDFRDWEW